MGFLMRQQIESEPAEPASAIASLFPIVLNFAVRHSHSLNEGFSEGLLPINNGLVYFLKHDFRLNVSGDLLLWIVDKECDFESMLNLAALLQLAKNQVLESLSISR